MKKLYLTLVGFMFYSAIIQAQEITGGEFQIYFVDRPEEWEVSVSITSTGTHWDCDHQLTSSYSGGIRYYDQDSDPYNHYSDGCWSPDGYTPFLGLSLYRIVITETDPDDDSQDQVWFDFDWRTSDLPPTLWTDQSFAYSLTQNKIYRYADPNKVSVNSQTLTLWGESEDIELDTTGLEPYAPTNLSAISYYGHPKLLWSHPNLSDDYRTGYEVWRNLEGWEKIATQAPQNNLWVDWTFDYGSCDVQYKVRAINGTAISDWSNTITIYPSKKQGAENHIEQTYEFKLEQNFPNPFNPRTTIEFSLKDDAFVTLKIFDILGTEIALLINENLNAGLHATDFESNNFGSGIYFYELKANNYREIKKLIIAK